MKSIVIHGQKIGIKVTKKAIVDQDQRPLAGYYDDEKKQIVISGTLLPVDQFKTLVHEIGHALLYRLGIVQTSMSHDLHELIVEGYSNLIYDHFEFKKKGRKKHGKGTKHD